MDYSAKILADSVSPVGVRLTTFEVTFPRIVLAEFNTHREFSRNSASSRAIPVEKQIAKIMADPFVPIYWGRNQKGMQAEQELTQDERILAEANWLDMRDEAVRRARNLLDIGVHKQITNRLLEPWMWHTVIVTATQWENYFNLRCHPDAQPEIQRIAKMMRDLYESSSPVALQAGEWHLPLVEPGEVMELVGGGFDVKKVSAGRCARVSYLTHDGRRAPAEDALLCDRLLSSGHLSPLEHPAMALDTLQRNGNFIGWMQLRKTLPGEAVFRPSTSTSAT